VEVAELLLAAGAEVNGRGGDRMALYAAARRGDEAMVTLLLEKGADINANDGAVGTALHAAAIGGHKDVAELLLERGADANVRTSAGVTPLVAAELVGAEDVAQVLRQSQTAAPVSPRGPRGLYPQRGLYDTAMPTEGELTPVPAYGQQGNALDVLSDPNAIRQNVASFPGLVDTLAALDENSRMEQRSWQQRRIDNRSSLLRTTDKQFSDELAAVKTTAQQENANQTIQAVDELLTQRQQRQDVIADALREERRAALQAEREAARSRGRGATGVTTMGRRGRGRDMQTTETTTYAETGTLYGRAAQEEEGPPLDQETQALLQAWTAPGASEDKRSVLEAATDADLRDLGALRTAALGEQARQTTAVIEGLMLAHQERRDHVLQRIAESEERQQRLEERAATRGRGTTLPEGADTQAGGRRYR
jgi:ankyrin repeat protein